VPRGVVQRIGAWRPAGFELALGAIAAAGGLIRIAWIEKAPFRPGGLIVDETYYHRVANFIADGAGYISPYAFDAGHRLPSAEKPPLYPLLLALESKVGGSSFHAHQLLGAVLGAATIVLLGLVAKRIGGPRLGLITAAIVALDPELWKWDSQVLSEPLYAPLVALVLLLAYRLGDRMTLGRAALVGAAIGLAGLARPEALIFAPLLALLLLAWRRRGAVRPILALCVVCALVTAPWVVRNWSAFGRPLISNQSAETIAGANCPTTYYGIGIGFWDVRCIRPPGTVLENEADRAAAQKATGVRYARDHLGRLPLVVLARIGRTWGVFRPVATPLDTTVGWVLLVLALPGLAILRRRRVPVAILLLPAAVVTIASAISFGWLRYRFGADLALIVLAAAAVEAAAGRLVGTTAGRARS
jgi:4-amino-4-deoxy-L-arabinose transferase-like glycosyltransferase